MHRKIPGTIFVWKFSNIGLPCTRFSGIDLRQDNLPGELVWPQAENIDEAIKIIQSKDKNLQGIIIEPIQATYGDNYLAKNKLLND